MSETEKKLYYDTILKLEEIFDENSEELQELHSNERIKSRQLGAMVMLLIKSGIIKE